MTDFLNSYDVQPDELTISEVAKILRCSRQMVLKICHKYKDLPYYKLRRDKRSVLFARLGTGWSDMRIVQVYGING